MRRNALALASLVTLVLAVSGCTIPGTDITFPWFNGGTTDYTNDIIVIKSLQVTPGTTVKSGQTMTLYADIQNVQDPEKVAGMDLPEVSIDLYDYCTNLFENDPTGSLNQECKGKFRMSPQEIKTCSWTLDPRSVNLITPCQLKVKVNYQYKTETITSVTFIDAAELEARIRRGEPWQVSGSTTRGYGPVKVYLEVETQQPVPDSDSGQGAGASISMKIRNVGKGYVKDSAIMRRSGGIGDETGFIPPVVSSPLGWETPCDFEYTRIKAADGNEYDGIKLVRKETTPKFCKLLAPDVDVEQTYDITTSVGYDYEFRKSINVQIEPR